MHVTLPPNFARAVDLSSLGKPKVASTGPMAGIEVTPTNLTTEILVASRTKPVIIICWSARSPESVEMVTTLGKIASESAGAWLLARVDIDAQPQVAQALQVATIPFAVALIKEQMVPLFEQNYPEAQVRLVIDKVLTLAAEQGIGEAPVEKIEPEEDEALAALEAGDFISAESAYKKLLNRKPNDPFAKLGLAQTQLLIRTEKLDPAVIKNQADKNLDDVALQINAADMSVVTGDIEAAFNRLLDFIRAHAGDEKTKAKDHLLILFVLVDPADSRVIAARNALANALY
jgi:putative thioredoxin